MGVFLTLLSHAIADGFGATDGFGICQTNPETLRRAVKKFFSELIINAFVLWNTWFSVAAFSVLGCSMDSEQPDMVAEGASELVAAQYGSLVVVANWADLTVEKYLHGSFGFHHTEGRLVGVGDEYAVEYSEKTMKPPEELANGTWTFDSDDDADSPDVADPIDIMESWQLKEDLEKTKVSIDTAIIGAGSPYRLLTMIKSGNYQRIIDPSFNLLALSRSEMFQRKHDGPHPEESISINLDHISFWIFGELLGDWDTPNHTFDRHTKCGLAN